MLFLAGVFNNRYRYFPATRRLQLSGVTAQIPAEIYFKYDSKMTKLCAPGRFTKIWPQRELDRRSTLIYVNNLYLSGCVSESDP